MISNSRYMEKYKMLHFIIVSYLFGIHAERSLLDGLRSFNLLSLALLDSVVSIMLPPSVSHVSNLIPSVSTNKYST